MTGKSQSVFNKFPELKEIPMEKFPHHMLLIPDGNGRWAKLVHKKIIEGHKKGAEVILNIYKDLWQLPIQFITIWGFSADNWKRSKDETEGIMMTIDQTLQKMLPDAMEKNSRIIHLGRKDRLPKFLLSTLENAEEKTKNNTGKVLCLAVDYSGQDQEVRMFQRMKESGLATFNQEDLVKFRDGDGLVPPADLIIRTSGEKRTSDLGWLAINSELSFITKLLPNIGTKDIVSSIIDFSKRERRFGARPA